MFATETSDKPLINVAGFRGYRVTIPCGPIGGQHSYSIQGLNSNSLPVYMYILRGNLAG